MTSRSMALLALGLSTCTTTEPGSTEDVSAATCAFNDNSLIETDSIIVNDTNFSLEKVFDRIRVTTPSSASDPVTIPTSAVPMFQELYAAFDDCTSSSTVDPNDYGLSCRPAEASLATLNPFSGTGTNPLHYKPVALVNRLDLAPADFSYCGESRIIYWKDSGVVGRAAIAVELQMPAAIVGGVKTCQPVIDFWAHLSSVTAPATRASLLADFYFNGIAGTPSKPVTLPSAPVSASGAGYGGPGQVRLNSFVGFVQWNLRELKWKKVCTSGTTGCSAHFVEQTVKHNPSQLLFAGTHAKAPAFQTWFATTATPSLAAATSVTEIALDNANAYNTFESVSQAETTDPTNVDYGSAADAALRTKIATQLGSGSPLTVDDVLARATTQTCAGCHEISNGEPLGGGLQWPESNGFTMIDENAKRAKALTGVFLPFRLRLLTSLECPDGATSTGEPSDGAFTVAGLPVGGAN